MFRILEQNNIDLPEGAKKSKVGNKTNEHKRCHALKAVFYQSQVFLIISGTSNHMVSSKESFTSMYISRGPSIHMEYYSQISTVKKGSIKFERGVFNNELYVPSLVANSLYVY